MKIYDFPVKDTKGNTISMREFEGKVLLIVNTATGCGFTPQYAGLQKLYDKYKEQGFVVLDFPCNQFANQAPGSQEEIQSFCMSRYAVTFPLFYKIDVNGEYEEPLYRFLKSQQKGLINNKIKWNFTKFLVDKDGNVVQRFSPTTEPDKIEAAVVGLLDKH
jgi:glutathione peroxidase